jgi:hypothetical protein
MATTANAREPDVEIYRRVGFSATIAKPFSRLTVLKVVEGVLQKIPVAAAIPGCMGHGSLELPG